MKLLFLCFKSIRETIKLQVFSCITPGIKKASLTLIWEISKLQLFEISLQEIFFDFLNLADHILFILFRNLYCNFHFVQKKKIFQEEHFARLVEDINKLKLKNM